MAKLVLHIGTHKTATTTIQDMFRANAPLLEQHGLIYPRLGPVTGHHGLVYDWGALPPVFKLHVSSLNALKWINREFAHREGTVLLSSEEFSRGDPERRIDFNVLRSELSDFDSVEVICVLRQQWQFLQSVYLELSKTQIPKGPPEMIAQSLSTGMSEGLWIDYNLLLDHLEQVFAPEEITLMNFDTAVKGEGGIVGHMLRHLGVDLKVSDLKAVNGGASNVSPRPLTAWVANIASEPYPAPGWLMQMAQRCFDANPNLSRKTTLFSQAELKNLEAHFTVLNDKLEKRRASVQPGFAMPRPDIDSIGLFRNTLPNEIWVRLSRFMTTELVKCRAAEQVAAPKATVNRNQT